jgi:hypothetical protein
MKLSPFAKIRQFFLLIGPGILPAVAKHGHAGADGTVKVRAVIRTGY